MSILSKNKKDGGQVPEIVQKDDATGLKVLRQKAVAVAPEKIPSSKIQNLLLDMQRALATQSDGVALAAPQIAESLRIFIVNPKVFQNADLAEVKFENTTKTETVYINPVIIKKSRDKKKMEEGCLSVRPLYGTVRRASRVTVEALNEAGQRFQAEGSGLLAQIFQHEIDHLDGVLFTDKAKDLHEIDLEKLKKSHE